MTVPQVSTWPRTGLVGERRRAYRGQVPERTDLAERIRAAYQRRDLDSFALDLAEGVRWGADDHPNRCRGRADVLRTFGRWLDSGVTADVGEGRVGPRGVLIPLHVSWPDPADRRRGQDFFHVFLVDGGLISEIRRYDDVGSAAAAIGSVEPVG